MESGIRVFSVAGIPIRIHASWLAIYALITWTLAVGYFPRVLPDLPALAYWRSGLVAALLLFVSVLLHELSHSFVAIRYGLRVRGITLHVFGGVSHLEDEPPAPRAEFVIAAAGPLTSFAIAGVLWALERAGVVAGGTAGAVVSYLIGVNVAVGVFNLFPGFPLDGGRLLRAILWWWKGTLGRATHIASRVGVFFAVALMAVGVLQILYGAFVSGLWLILIGLFLRGAADASDAQVALREALARVPVRDIMTRDVVSVRGDATVGDLVEDFWSHHFTSFPVMADGRVQGIAALPQIHEVARDRWAQARVADVMRPLADDLVIGPGDSAYQALEKAAGNGLGRLAVMEGPRLVGYLSLKDITHVLALKGLRPLTADRLQRAGATTPRRAA
jgi:Zn-dependent protease